MKNLIKKLMVLVVCLSVILSAGGIKNVSAAVKATPIIKLDGTVIPFPTDGIPYVDDNNRTMVSARFVTESMKCKVDWSEPSQLITITKGEKKIFLVIGQEWATVFNTISNTSTRKTFDTKSILKGDRTFVPLRFISEALGASVAWDETNNTVIVRSDGTIEQTAITPTTPTPQKKSWKNVEVPMTIVGSDEMPEGFIKPQFVIKHHPSGLGGYFALDINNILDYKDTASDYIFKVTCLNYDLINWTSNIPDITRTDYEINLNTRFSKKNPSKVLWVAPSQNYKFNNHPELGEVTIQPGTVLEMQVEFYYAGLKQVYKDSITLMPEVEE